MIRYTLRCDREHEFDAWFRSSADYDRAALAGENVCPACGSTAVAKAMMAPSVSGARKSEKMTLAAPDPKSQAMREALKEFRKRVTENADYVGDKFAEEARKIHYEEVEARGIYGEATPDEARDLVDEGISFQPLPPAPEDRN
ncbi:MAG: DUF1178 family protein [Bauldia sp.]